MKKPESVVAAILVLLVLSACGGSPSLIGTWNADDGTTKIVNSDGTCSGMYYDWVEMGSVLWPTPLYDDIQMNCSMSSEKGADGRYTLVVTWSMDDQGPYKGIYKVSFASKTEAYVYDQTGKYLMFSIKRQ